MVKNRTLVLLSVFAFLFNTTFPFFQTLDAKPVDGYTTVVCTLSGEQAVFIAFDDNTSQKHSASDCLKCPLCLVLSNASVWIPDFDLSVSASLFRQSQIVAKLRTIDVTSTTFSHYLSQGPPVWT